MSISDPPLRILIRREQIERRLDELAESLSADPDCDELTFLVVLTGAMLFAADLVRRLDRPVRLEPVSLRSYPGQATRSQGVEVRMGPEGDWSGRDVLIVDDILDSGQTLAHLVDLLRDAGAQRVRTCVLLRKDRPDLPDRADADLVGFDVPDEFVVGYGLDYGGLYRNLPHVGVLAEHAREG